MSARAGAGIAALAMSERQLQAAVVEVARALGWRVHFTWNSRHSPAGFPDLLLCRPPRLVVIELKREDGRATPEQREWLSDLTACGVPSFLFRPSDWVGGLIETVLK